MVMEQNGNFGEQVEEIAAGHHLTTVDMTTATSKLQIEVHIYIYIYISYFLYYFNIGSRSKDKQTKLEFISSLATRSTK
jgi:hypothetical protein